MVVSVIFSTGGKVYNYNTNIDMIKGGIYDIVADGYTTYTNYVIIHDIKPGYNKSYRTITDAKFIKGPAKPQKPYKLITVNEAKQTVCVVWKDGTKTVMKPQEGDEFDFEKGVAMCFMKKAFGNRGCFNDAFRDIHFQ